MGTWDVSVFGNDDAADFSFEFSDANSVAEVAPVIENALDTVLNSAQDLEAPDGAIGLAAAALVVAWSEPGMLGNEAAYAPQPWPRSWSMGLGNVASAPVSDAVTAGIGWGTSLVAAEKDGCGSK